PARSTTPWRITVRSQRGRASAEASRAGARPLSDSTTPQTIVPLTVPSVAAAEPMRDGAVTPFGDGRAARCPGAPHGGMVAAPAKETRMNELLITPAGLARLEAELERLQTTGRLEAAERLRQAASSEADLSASADYQAAREEQARLEGRIARLAQRLAAIQIAESYAGNGVLDLGERVRLRDLDTG